MDVLFDFVGDSPNPAWPSVNDGVMGGISRGGASIVPEGMRFKGILSLENNGGFSSIRRNVELDLSGYRGIAFQVRGDGRTYDLRIESNARLWGRWPVSFGSKFETQRDEWIEVRVPFDTLNQTWRGRQLEGYNFDPSKIQMLGFLIGDKSPGEFQLEIARVSAFR